MEVSFQSSVSTEREAKSYDHSAHHIGIPFIDLGLYICFKKFLFLGKYKKLKCRTIQLFFTVGGFVKDKAEAVVRSILGKANIDNFIKKAMGGVKGLIDMICSDKLSLHLPCKWID